MKKKLLIILVTIPVFTQFDLMAQNWQVGGNTLPQGGGTFGSNNPRVVIFETANTPRGRLTGTGLWGFGSNFDVVSPAAQVHINALSATTNPLQVDVAGTNRLIVTNIGRVGIGTSSPSGRLHVNSATGEDGFRVQIAGSTKFLVGSGGGASIGTTTAGPANGLFVAGNVGIGTSTPPVRLNVSGGSDVTPTGGGFIISGVNGATNIGIDDNEIMARAGGGVSTLFFNNNGGNIVIDATSNTSNVGIGLSNPTFQLQLTRNSAAKPTSSVWTVSSDMRLKKDVGDFTDGMNIINKIRPVWFTYNGEAGMPANERAIGTVAQELQKAAPYMVKDFTYQKDEKSAKTNYLTVDYHALFFLFINALKEQQSTIDKLQHRLAKLEATSTAVSSDQSGLNKNIAGISLEQNQPNPFKSATVIRYKIPVGSNTQINVYDVSGNLIKTMRANESGQTQISGSDLKAGTYTYSLMVDGKIGASKKFIVAK